MNARRINVIGAGSLGSFTVLLLVKMARVFGCEIKIWDFDRVESHNLTNQLYREADLTKPKVEALKEIIKGLTHREIETEAAEVDDQSPLHGVVIVLVDSMKARRAIFNACSYQIDIPFYIEARAGGTGAIVYALDPRSSYAVERYEKNLYGDTESVAAACATERTIPITWFIAAVILNILTRFNGQKIPVGEFIETTININDLPTIESKLYTD